MQNLLTTTPFTIHNAIPNNVVIYRILGSDSAFNPQSNQLKA